LEDQDFYCYSTDSDEHQEASGEGGEVNSASGQASPPTVIELSDDEPEEEPAEEQEPEEEPAEEPEQGGDPDEHSDPEDSDPEDGDADDHPAPERWQVVICHHDGGHARFPYKLRRLFQRLQLHMTIDYVGLKKTHPRYPTQWDVSVRILEDNPLDGGQYEVVVHQALATRATFAAGRDDAARRALSVWCYEEAHHLTNSVWGDFPVVVLELWAVRFQWLMKPWEHAMQCKWDTWKLSIPTWMTPSWSFKTSATSKMKTVGRSRGSRQ
jgi:hypothetical protein